MHEIAGRVVGRMMQNEEMILRYSTYRRRIWKELSILIVSSWWLTMCALEEDNHERKSGLALKWCDHRPSTSSLSLGFLISDIRILILGSNGYYENIINMTMHSP